MCAHDFDSRSRVDILAGAVAADTTPLAHFRKRRGDLVATLVAARPPAAIRRDEGVKWFEASCAHEMFGVFCRPFGLIAEPASAANALDRREAGCALEATLRAGRAPWLTGTWIGLDRPEAGLFHQSEGLLARDPTPDASLSKCAGRATDTSGLDPAVKRPDLLSASSAPATPRCQRPGIVLERFKAGA